MSEQQNVQTVKNAYAAFGRGDIQGVLNELTDDVEWHLPGEGLIPQAGTYRGTEGVSRFFQNLDQTTQFAKFEPRSFVAEGDHVVARGHYQGTAKSTGRAFEADWVMVFTFKGNKVAKFQEYTDTAAIAQAYVAAKAA
jgi:ketosteroid isomerase-like protein